MFVCVCVCVCVCVRVCVRVCVCVNFYCVNDFSGTTDPRILKFGTNVGYN